MPRAQPKMERHPPPRCQARLIPGPSLANFLKDGGVTGGWSDTVEPIRLGSNRRHSPDPRGNPIVNRKGRPRRL